MGKTLFRAILLVGLGIVVGFAHAQLNRRSQTPLMLKLPDQKQPEQMGTTSADPQPIAANPAPTPAAPEQPAAAPPVHPEPVQAAAPAEVPVPSASAPAAAPADSGYFISLAKAKELFDGKQTGAWDGIFIDARPLKEFTAAHIPGAMHLEKSDFDRGIPAKVRNYLPGMSVVIYCHGENCTDSEAVAARLLALNRGIGPIHIIKEGLPGWQSAGYPVEVGPEVGFD
jgi:rhodanese-related sulfurtransferase